MGEPFLARMARHSEVRAASLLEHDLRNRVQDAPAPVPWVPSGFVLLAEIKPRSPSEGVLDASASSTARAHAYATAGASAISVLTEPSAFGGSMDDVQKVVSAMPGVPVMRKDFLVDPRQLWEARAFGASGVLLIVALLPGKRLRSMVQTARDLGLFVLVEAFDALELARAAELAPDEGVLLGVNCRDLRTLQVAPERFAALSRHLPADRVVVAESGLHGPGDIARVRALGYRGALVGTALMRAADPARAVGEMRRAACG